MKENVSGEGRRTLIKGLLAAGTAALVGRATKGKAGQVRRGLQPQDQEILYRETEEFKAYYRSLLD